MTALLLVLLATAGLSQGELVITREGTAAYHRPGCPEIHNRKDVLAMTRAQAERRGMKAHAECDPAKAPAGAKPLPPVFVDSAGKYYHRAKCAKLGPGARQVTVEQVARTHWPCRVCKAPIRPRAR